MSVWLFPHPPLCPALIVMAQEVEGDVVTRRYFTVSFRGGLNIEKVCFIELLSFEFLFPSLSKASTLPISPLTQTNPDADEPPSAWFSSSSAMWVCQMAVGPLFVREDIRGKPRGGFPDYSWIWLLE